MHTAPGRSGAVFFLMDCLAGRTEGFCRPFAGTSEDRLPRVLSAIRPLPCSLRCARERAPVAATRGGKPSEVEHGAAKPLGPTCGAS